MKNQIVACALAIILVSLAHQWLVQPSKNQDQCNIWQQSYGIRLSPQEEFYRCRIYEQNAKFISEHNSQSLSYELGINHFAHLTPNQFKNLYSSSVLSESLNTVKTFPLLGQSNLKQEIDWQKQGKVSQVQSQGQCDAGYSFCTSSLMESFLLIKNQTSLLLSAQQIVDCSGEYQTFGCSGGTRTGAIKFVQEKGLKLSSEYPFKAVQGTCKFSTGSYKLPSQIAQADGCDALAQQLKSSPLTIAANTDNWQFYRTGILNTCGTQVQHDVFLVGVTPAYWKIKNSWGVRWGQYGYIRIAPGETCGICSKPGFGFK